MKYTKINCSLVVIAFFLFIKEIGVEFANAEVSKKQLNQTCYSNAILIPEIATDYVLIYKPKPDVYSLKDTKNYKSGGIYDKWQPNDHTFVKGPNGRWHCIGITRIVDNPEVEDYEGKGLSFHALAPLGTLEEVFLPETWFDQPKLQLGDAPFIVKIEDTYNYINSANDHCTSVDLYNWKDIGKLQLKEENGKNLNDPNIFYWNGIYYMVRSKNNSINLVTSTDFVNWTDSITIFTAPVESWQCESPTLLRYDNKFYLFWCLWDSSPDRAKSLALYKGHTPWLYDYRTFVYVSDIPTDFKNKKPIAQLKAHAPEIIQDEKGNYFISSADYPSRGINLARLKWKSIDSRDKEK